MKLVKRYAFFIITLLITTALMAFNREIGTKAIDTIKYSFKEMIVIIPPIFILLGLLDVWVPRETVAKYMGEKSGLIGIILSILLGSVAAGPLYGAFPVASILMKKGVKFSNILVLIGAWSTTKVPLLLFEIGSLGLKFALTRLLVNIIGIFIIAQIVNKSIEKEELEDIYKSAYDC